MLLCVGLAVLIPAAARAATAHYASTSPYAAAGGKTMYRGTVAGLTVLVAMCFVGALAPTAYGFLLLGLTVVLVLGGTIAVIRSYRRGRRRRSSPPPG